VRTALVLSAGGMFGAYQAGAWKAIAHFVRPDLVVGASAGALNGWAIAGGCSPEDLAARWLDPGASLLKFRDATVLERGAREIFDAFPPSIEFEPVVTEWPSCRPRAIPWREVTWRHLAASCSIPGITPLQRIGGKTLADGGILRALPLWAVAQKSGVGRVIAVNVLDHPPSRLLRAVIGAFRSLARLPEPGPEVEVLTIAPGEPLGSLHDAVVWRRENAARWIARGEREARQALEIRYTSSNAPVASRT